MQNFWLFFGLLVILGLACRAVLVRRRQIRTLQTLAASLRLNYSLEDFSGVHERYQNLNLIRQGHSRHASHLVFGSTDVGLVALFRYSYDLSSGVNQSTRQWWIVVMETPHLHEHWRAFPAFDHEPTGHWSRIDRFDLRTDRAHTADELIEAGIERVLKNASADYHFEARGPLVAVATPANNDPDKASALLTCACDLARVLVQPAADN